MKFLKFIIISTALLLLQKEARSQYALYTIDYNFGIPMGNLSDFISESAYRGGNLSFTRFLESNEQIGIGFSFDWQGFYEKVPRGSFPIFDDEGETNTDLNAVQFRYYYASPLRATFSYYFLKDETILPYLGLNAGIQYSRYELAISTLDNTSNTSWDFVYGIEGGIHVVFGDSNMGMNLLGKYNLSTSDYYFSNVDVEIENSSFLSVCLGLTFYTW